MTGDDRERMQAVLQVLYVTITRHNIVDSIYKQSTNKKRLLVKCGIAECGMRKVKCGIENAERRWFFEAANHVSAVFPHITATLIYVYRNRQSGKMQPRNAENANTGARMHLVPDSGGHI